MAVANGLPHSNNVRYKVLSLQLEGPKVRADTTETHLDFISNENAARLVNMPVEGQVNFMGDESGQCQSNRELLM